MFFKKKRKEFTREWSKIGGGWYVLHGKKVIGFCEDIEDEYDAMIQYKQFLEIEEHFGLEDTWKEEEGDDVS